MGAKTFDDSTVAALPSALTLSSTKYREYFHRSRLATHAGSTLPWSMRKLPLVGKHIIHWTQTEEHLESGCLNPAIIISKSDSLVAVFTNLSAAGGQSQNLPYLKIYRERIDLIPHKYVQDQARLATSTQYYRTSESWRNGRWCDFHPIVVNCLVEDNSQCESAQSRLKPLAWKALEIAIDSISEVREGLFPV